MKWVFIHTGMHAYDMEAFCIESGRCIDFETICEQYDRESCTCGLGVEVLTKCTV